VKINCEFNTDKQHWEYSLALSDGRMSYVYENPDPKDGETRRRNDLVNWLNKCFEENDKS
jgi:hypothetical protein